MKIAYVYDAVYPWVTGGVEKRIWELAHRLSTDHEIHWYGIKYWEGPDVRRRDGVVLHGVMDPPDSLYTNGRRSIVEALSFASHLVKPLLDHRFDVIDCQQFPYFPCFPCKVASRVLDATLVVTWHEVWATYWYDYLGYKGVFGEAVERTLTHLPDAHIAVSKHTQKDLDEFGVTGVHCVPNGIAVGSITETRPAARTPDVLFVGRLIAEKNVDLLIDAIAIITETRPDVECLVIGDGPERDRLRDRISTRGLAENVTLVDGKDSHDAILASMKAAKVFVLPSRREGFGITVLEALACGTPVVTIDHPRNAARELVDHGSTGFVCQPTSEALARAVLAASSDIASDACAAAGRAYDWDVIASQAEAVYQEVA